MCTSCQTLHADSATARVTVGYLSPLLPNPIRRQLQRLLLVVLAPLEFILGNLNADPGSAELRARADLLAAQAKLFAANAAWDAADRAVQIYGGRGYSTLYRPGRHLMDVRVCRIYEGTDEILKLKIAAAVLGKEYEAYK